MSENAFYPQGEPQNLYGAARQETLSRYTAKVYALMFAGLLVTFGIAAFFAWTAPGRVLLDSARNAVPALHFIILVAELVVVLVMSARVRKISPAAATVCFFVYSVLTGLTFALIFLAYDLTSLLLVFGFTALYFGGMALFGSLTRLDLSRLRNLLLGGLIALVVVNLLMLFLPGLEAIDHVMCTLGVVLFLAYTAYDAQKIKAYYYGFQGDDAMLKKAGVISALELYLDFINLFLYLLRLFGRNRD